MTAFDAVRAQSARHVHYVPVGSYNTGPENRGLHSVLLASGWPEFARQAIDPGIALGARRVLLMDPFGRGPKGEVEWDAPLQADHIDSRGFVDVMLGHRRSGNEVITYKGSPFTTSGMALRRNNPRVWAQRFIDAAELELDAKLSIAVDNTSASDEQDHVYHALRMLERLIASYGGRLYCENVSLIRRDSKAWGDLPGITSWPTWRGWRPSGAEMLCLLEGDDFSAARIKEISDAGMTPVYPLHRMTN